MWNNRLSFGSIVVVTVGLMVPFWVLMMLSNRASLETLLRFWWVSPLLMVACIGFYVFSFYAIESSLKKRRERLINVIAGART